MPIVDYTDALKAGWRVFPLHDIIYTPEGAKCGCEREDCQAAGKHPRSRNWQRTPIWDDDQLAYLEDYEGLFNGNQLTNGYGIVVDTSGLLVVDVDGRNGGLETAKGLQHIRDQCGFIVQSGSGYGEHWYFTIPEGSPPLMMTHPDYKGIDFKSNGFVVGVGSLHASGNRYYSLKGTPADITEAPQELIDLIKRKAPTGTFTIEGTTIDEYELAEIIKHVRHDAEQSYERWLAVGMALHHATGGADSGKQLWERWTLAQGRDDTESICQKWHGFGKSATPITQGSLLTWAREGGYSPPVEFTDTTDWGYVEFKEKPATKNDIDLLAPPGFVGEIAKWIDSRCVFPRRSLAVAAAIQLVGNAAGLNYLVDKYDTSLNLITIAVAGSRTGKGAIKKCIDEVHAALGLAPATHGKFKSSQELLRNAIHHQAVHYIYDEFGKQLDKISGASKGGAHYLEDLLAELIAIYSEATGVHGISGDMKRELRDELEKRIAREVKKAGLADDENPSDYIKDNPDSDLAKAYRMLNDAENGIVNPYLTFFGMTEPNSYNAAIEKDPWLLNGGFMGRALYFEELDNVPKRRDIDSVFKGELPGGLMMRLQSLSTGGSQSVFKGERIERKTDWVRIPWSKEASALIEQVYQYYEDVAHAEQDAGSGLESQALGATELVIKVAGILSVADGEIPKDNVKWAHELIKSITLDKIASIKSSAKLAGNNTVEKSEGLLEAIMRHMRALDGTYTTTGKVRQAAGRSKVTTEQTQAALDYLVGQGDIVEKEVKGRNGRVSKHYYLS